MVAAAGNAADAANAANDATADAAIHQLNVHKV